MHPSANHIKQKLLQWKENLTKKYTYSMKFKYISFQIRDLTEKERPRETEKCNQQLKIYS